MRPGEGSFRGRAGGAVEALMRAEAEVVGEGEFEPSIEVLEDQRLLDLEASGLLQRPLEAFEPCCREDPVDSAEALFDAESCGRLAEYPDLTLEQVYAALAYYYGHKEEIEADFVREQDAAFDFDSRKAEVLARRARESWPGERPPCAWIRLYGRTHGRGRP